MAYRHLNTERVQVAATLRQLREDRRISRDAVAGILGCTVSKIGDLEVGLVRPEARRDGEAPRFRDGVHGPRRRELIEFARLARKRKPRGTYGAGSVPANLRRSLDLEAQATSSIYYWVS